MGFEKKTEGGYGKGIRRCRAALCEANGSFTNMTFLWSRFRFNDVILIGGGVLNAAHFAVWPGDADFLHPCDPGTGDLSRSAKLHEKSWCYSDLGGTANARALPAEAIDVFAFLTSAWSRRNARRWSAKLFRLIVVRGPRPPCSSTSVVRPLRKASVL